MAAILPKGGLPSSYFDNNGDSNGGSNLKLRDSCLACANSKLRCPREKPRCARCAKRDVKCEYVATKRAGRKQGSLSNTNNKHSEGFTVGGSYAPKPLAASDKKSPSLAGSDFAVMSPQATIASGSTDHAPTGYYSAFPSTDFEMSDVAASDINKDLEELLAFCPQPTPGMPEDPYAIDWNNPNLFNNNDTAMSVTDDQIDFTSLQSLLNFSNPESSQLDFSAFMASPVTNMDTQPQQPSPDSSSEPCTCVAQALGFVQQLYQAPSAGNHGGSPQTGDQNTTNMTSTVKAIISRNNTIADEVEKFLRCPVCSHSGFMLTILYFLVSRLLGWYAAAARKAHSADHASALSSQEDGWATSSILDSHSRNSSVSTTLSGPGDGSPVSYFVEGQDSARAAAHMVVNEMHRVRDLVTQLFSQLSLRAAIGSSIPDSSTGLDYVENTDWPLSGTILKQLGIDLRKRIKALTTDILSMLRTW